MRQNAKVYVLKAIDGTLKVGHSINPAARLRQIDTTLSLVHETDILAEAERVERAAHKLLMLAGAHVRGEWFSATIEQAISAIDRATAMIGLGQPQPDLGGRTFNGYGRPKSKTAMGCVVMLRLPDDLQEFVNEVAASLPDRQERSAAIRLLLREAREWRKRR